MTQDAAENLKTFGVTTLSDALDRLGIEGQCLGIMPFARSMRLAGPAFTIRMLPTGQSGGSVGDYIDDVQPGQIVVIDNDGRMDATVWGDILTLVADRRGIGGTVIDGVCRDIDRSIELDYPIYARANTMRTGKDRVTADAYNVTVQIAGIRIAPGDWLVGDGDGVICIPASRVQEVIEVAGQIAAAEEKIREAVLRGDRLDETRKKLRYHALQTRESGAKA
ncbi:MULTISPECIES: RraA family protein [Bradyrhizobium]|uniref:Putative 4-hydroxy-4-methyl-2-oxoglutarate aldolase n=3 Tax=Bradyrhizobium TaxID=374 RepID=A0A410VIC3_9BRAD|nr:MULTISPECIES: RraA family protein [Bradyrhizobium]MCG2628221.1 RraA family protein [Bradyrhizobium zhengyangense]MCG2643340.1 RraA family protein [Bradyrhizobium zhengyangense]MCG2670346.1 RraA family protein [Bradyrhizobium zhengyangense]MDN4985919.1 RraA family protein [Bradyrhizobium sp. WYCCWR 13022]MDN5002702.1 RraA family protein [Bradyrhizobium sp. WYCCWR 12677]